MAPCAAGAPVGQCSGELLALLGFGHVVIARVKVLLLRGTGERERGS